MNDEARTAAEPEDAPLPDGALEVRVLIEVRGGEQAVSIEGRWHVPGSPEPQPCDSMATLLVAIAKANAVLAQQAPLAPPSRVLLARPRPGLLPGH